MDPLEFELEFVANKIKYNLGAVSAGSITSTELASNSVTSDKIAAGAVTVDKLTPSFVTLNTNTISSNYTFAAGFNGVSAGPITISNGVTVTVPSGGAWSIV